MILLLQLLPDGNQVDAVVFVEEVEHRLVDAAVSDTVEVPGLDDLDYLRQGGVVEQNGTQNRLLSLEILRWKLREGEVNLGHGSPAIL